MDFSRVDMIYCDCLIACRHSCQQVEQWWRSVGQIVGQWCTKLLVWSSCNLRFQTSLKADQIDRVRWRMRCRESRVILDVIQVYITNMLCITTRMWVPNYIVYVCFVKIWYNIAYEILWKYTHRQVTTNYKCRCLYFQV